jgi:hypothetical protein
MRALSLPQWGLLLAGAVGLALLCGCSASQGSGGTGYGADAGPWPKAPTRATPKGPATTDTPTVPLYLLVHGTTAAEETLRVELVGLEVKFDGRWITVAQRDDFARFANPVTLTAAGTPGFALSTTLPRRIYTHLRVRFGTNGRWQQGDTTRALTIPTLTHTLPEEWTPPERVPTVVHVTLTPTALAIAPKNASLPATALACTLDSPTGGLSGRVTPLLPHARVEALWADTRTVVGSALPTSPDGTFSITPLPAGPYRLEVRATGYRLLEPDRKAIPVGKELVPCDPLTLVPEAK